MGPCEPIRLGLLWYKQRLVILIGSLNKEFLVVFSLWLILFGGRDSLEATSSRRRWLSWSHTPSFISHHIQKSIRKPPWLNLPFPKYLIQTSHQQVFTSTPYFHLREPRILWNPNPSIFPYQEHTWNPLRTPRQLALPCTHTAYPLLINLPMDNPHKAA